MGILSESDAKKVSERFAGLETRVQLVMFTQEMECRFCSETHQIVEEVADTSAGITARVLDFVADKDEADALGIEKIPAIAVLREDGRDYGIRLYGIPSGYEFMSLLEAVELVSKGDSGLEAIARQKLAALESPVEMQVFVTPTCPYCPRAVVTAFRFAVESEMVRGAMVEATEFPHLANKYQVSGVPHTVIGDSKEPMVGAYPEGAAVDLVLAAAGA